MKKQIITLLISLPLLIQAQTTLPPDMVYVEGGTFTMGCTPEQVPDCFGGESPTRIVRIPSFEIGKYEVTQGQWQAVMGSNPGTGYGTSPDRPVYFVSFYDGITFCNRLSVLYGFNPVYYFDSEYTFLFDSLIGDGSYISFYINHGANGYRLSTEAEWEYVSRGGQNLNNQTKFSGSDVLDLVGWYGGNNSPNGVKQIGLKIPNYLDVYDMSGNLYEWCVDIYFGSYGNSSQFCCSCISYLCAVRGGNWYDNNPADCRIANRSNHGLPGNRDTGLGLRLARNAD